MQGHLIRECLHSGRRVYGTHVCSLPNSVAAGIYASVEYDFAFICNEHMPLDRTETSMMCQFYASRSISPIVRIPTPQAYLAAMALDSGAQGIVVPYVETEEQVIEMVGAVKYRPVKGKKLDGFLSGKTKPSPKMNDFLKQFNRDNYLIIGIESVPAYENLDRLISIPGVDGVFVGPHDMTVSMDLPAEYDHPDFLRMLHDIIKRCNKAGIGVGVHLSQLANSDQRFKELIDKGMNWIVYGADIALLISEMRKRLRNFRDHMEDTYTDPSDTATPPAASCLNQADAEPHACPDAGSPANASGPRTVKEK